MTALKILEDYLCIHGYDGLRGDDCVCTLDDLIICESNPYECVAVYRTECKGEECENPCDAYCQDHDSTNFCYVTEKPSEIEVTDTEDRDTKPQEKFLSYLKIELVNRCANAAVEWHDRVYQRDKGARQSLMKAVAEAGRQGLKGVEIKTSAGEALAAFLNAKPQEPSDNDILDLVIDIRNEMTLNESSIAMQAYSLARDERTRDETRRECEDARVLIIKTLKDWLKFASDVQPGDFAGEEWLEVCRINTTHSIAALDQLVAESKPVEPGEDVSANMETEQEDGK